MLQMHNHLPAVVILLKSQIQDLKLLIQRLYRLALINQDGSLVVILYRLQLFLALLQDLVMSQLTSHLSTETMNTIISQVLVSHLTISLMEQLLSRHYRIKNILELSESNQLILPKFIRLQIETLVF